MKKIIYLVVIPVALFALEKVNLIKDCGFEKDSDVWQTYTGRSDGRVDSAIAAKHDSERGFNGNFSASCDTRGGDYLGVAYDSAVVIQGLGYPKKVSDIDSLTLHYSLAPFKVLQGAWVGLYVDAGKYPHWIAGYVLLPEGQTPLLPAPWLTLQYFPFPDDTLWYSLMLDIKKDLTDASISANSSIDSLLVLGWGSRTMGQKIYWDAVRLTGYADFDVGVKKILSSEVIGPFAPYTPKASVKNFGRMDADNFLVIAEVPGLYCDTVQMTLPGDTEDTVQFKTGDGFGFCTLTVRTEMFAPGAIDESDEDDAVSKYIVVASVGEAPVPQAVTLEVSSFTASPKISYSLPAGESGTISIYNSSGRKVESLEVQGSGEVRLSAQSSGVYFVRLEALNRKTFTRKLVVLR